MKPPSPPVAPALAPTSSGVRRHTLVVAFLLVLVLLLQLREGAYQQEMTTAADEAAHFVSGLMVRDYALGGFSTDGPVAYAQDYYAHYPKVAIGNWPPGFYVLQGAWTALFPASYYSVLVLMAVIATATAWMVFWLLQRCVTFPVAVFGAAAFLLLTPVSQYFSSVMAELPLTCVALAATCLWVRFLETERPRYLALFALCVMLSVMTKWNGLFVFLIAPLTIIIGGRWRMLRMPRLWGGIAVVAAISALAIMRFLPTAMRGWPRPSQLYGNTDNLFFYPPKILLAIGSISVVVGLIGLVYQMRNRAILASKQGIPWVASAAGFLAVVGFHSVVPGGLFDLRHVLPAFPFIAVFLAGGVAALSTLALRAWPNLKATTGVIIGLVSAALILRVPPYHTWPLDGFRQAASIVVADAAARSDSAVATSLVVSSDAAGEGAFVVGVSVLDQHRPSHVVWRASKLLAVANWSGADYRLRDSTTAGVLALLDSAGITTLVVDQTTDVLPHEQLIKETLRAHPERFVLLGSVPGRRLFKAYDAGVLVYRVLADITRPRNGVLLRQVPGQPGVEPVPQPN